MKLSGFTNFAFTKEVLTMPGKAAKMTITERKALVQNNFSILVYYLEWGEMV